MTSLRRAWLVLFALIVTASVGWTQVLPAATPEAVGLSSARVGRLTGVVKDYVDRGQIAGVTLVVIRNGKIAVFEPIGRQDVERDVPLRKDAIFRLASMSKAVTSVAAVILMEEGKLRLSEPVSKYLPAFKNTTVIVPGPPSGTRYGAVPSKREITIRDLLTHTAGICTATEWRLNSTRRPACSAGISPTRPNQSVR